MLEAQAFLSFMEWKQHIEQFMYNSNKLDELARLAWPSLVCSIKRFMYMVAARAD